MTSRAKRAFCLSLLGDAPAEGFLKDPNRQKIAHDAKPLCRLALAAGAEIQGLHCDTKIAAYLLEPGSAPGYTVGDT